MWSKNDETRRFPFEMIKLLPEEDEDGGEEGVNTQKKINSI